MMKHHDYLDTTRLAHWVRAQKDATTVILGESCSRTLHRWATEVSRPVLFTDPMVDRMLTRLYVHEWEIPDYLWTDPPVCEKCGGQLRFSAEGRRRFCDGCKRLTRNARNRRKTRRRRERATAGLVKHGDQWVRVKEAV